LRDIISKKQPKISLNRGFIAPTPGPPTLKQDMGKKCKSGWAGYEYSEIHGEVKVSEPHRYLLLGYCNRFL
jgi:hypothetical protein